MNNVSTEQLFLTEAAKALLENPEQSPFLNLSRYQLWDLSGRDSWQLAKLLVSDAIAKIAPFQSLDFIFTGYQYSVLRLGDFDFRLGLYGELGAYGGLTFEETIRDAIANPKFSGASQWTPSSSDTVLRVGARKCQGINAIALPQAIALDLLPKITHVESPHRLEGLQPNRAVAAQIGDISVLIWRHQLLSQPIFELHPPVGDIEAIELKLINK